MITFLRAKRAIILLILLAAAGLAWLTLRPVQQGDAAAAQKARADFIATCKLQGRVANGGAAMPMDDATEDHLDHYCSCMADRLDQVLTPIEIGAIGGGTAGDDVMTKLGGVVAVCQQQNLAPAN
jgi:hypothetical protein